MRYSKKATLDDAIGASRALTPRQVMKEPRPKAGRIDDYASLMNLIACSISTNPAHDSERFPID